MKVKEEFFEECPSPKNRTVLPQAQADVKLHIHYE